MDNIGKGMQRLITRIIISYPRCFLFYFILSKASKNSFLSGCLLTLNDGWYNFKLVAQCLKPCVDESFRQGKLFST